MLQIDFTRNWLKTFYIALAAGGFCGYCIKLLPIFVALWELRNLMQLRFWFANMCLCVAAGLAEWLDGWRYLDLIGNDHDTRLEYVL